MVAVPIAGVVALIAAVALFFIQRHYDRKAFDVRRQAAGSIAEVRRLYDAVRAEAPAGYYSEPVAVHGIGAPLTPLESPFRRLPCLYFESSVIREYEVTETTRDSQGRETRRTDRRSETVSADTRRVRFSLSDEGGALEVDPEGAEIIAEQVMNEFRAGDQRIDGPWSTLGAVAQVALGALGGSRTIGYRYVEKAVPAGARIFVLAEAHDNQGVLCLGRPTVEGRRFIVSVKSRERLLGDLQSAARWIGVGAATAAGVGALLLLIALVVALR
ncbi:MAG: GIDE domain-containing protein [Dehalococcoidia bacterium]